MQSVSDAFKAHPLQLNRIVPLNFDSVQSVPDSHAWTVPHDYPSGDLSDFESVPVIDLGDPNAVRLVGHACKTWGAFQVMNHGIPMGLLEDAESETRRLFSLPFEQKYKVLRLPNGLTGYGLARLSSFFDKLMWSEGFTISGSPVEHASLLWPEDYFKFCDVMVEYQKEMKALAGRIMLMILSSLGITRQDVKWVGPTGELRDAQNTLQLNSYPVCPDPNKAMGLAPHTDSSLFTMIHQGSISGLQVHRDGVGWVTVPPLEGALIVNLGDLFNILTNDRFTSVLHRAVVNPTHHRFSIAYFCGPPKDVQISPSTTLIDPDHPPLYHPVTWNEYLAAKTKHFTKALESIRISAN